MAVILKQRIIKVQLLSTWAAVLKVTLSSRSKFVLMQAGALLPQMSGYQL